MLQSKQMTYYYFFWAVIVAVIVSLVHSQDFGFPEESGLAKDKQNANVSWFTCNIFNSRIWMTEAASLSQLDRHKNNKHMSSTLCGVHKVMIKISIA